VARYIHQSVIFQYLAEEDELIQQAITDITQLCAENVILWAQFLEAVTLNRHVHKYLAKEHHTVRVGAVSHFQNL
jgi:hypothetical protein